jgi:hypothetical protein
MNLSDAEYSSGFPIVCEASVFFPAEVSGPCFVVVHCSTAFISSLSRKIAVVDSGTLP